MPIPSSGAISLTTIQTEFGGTNPISINEYYAGGGLVPAGTSGTYGAVPSSGTISIQNFYGTTNAIRIVISQNTQNFNLLSAAQAAGFVNGSSTPIEVTINSGVYVWSDDTTLAGFDTGAITGSGTVTITNNGYIMGRGGNPGIAGGVALNLQKSIILRNNGFVAGGGGGASGGGGGAGGGTTAGRTSAGLGQPGSDGISGNSTVTATSGCGGRMLATNVSGGIAVSTTTSSAEAVGKGGQAGGSGAAYWRIIGLCGTGGGSYPTGIRRFLNVSLGGGGGWGAAAGSSVSFSSCVGPIPCTSGAGGSNNNAGGNAGQGGFTGTVTRTAGAAGGKSIQLNGYVCTQAVTGTIWGAIL